MLRKRSGSCWATHTGVVTDVPTTMTAYLLTGHGGYDQLELVHDHPVPQPGAGEVLVRVGACGLNNTDINTRTAWYSGAVASGITAADSTGGYDEAGPDGSWSGAELTFPRIQGADVAGRIVAVGAGVDAGRVGDRVLIDPWLLPADPAELGDARYFGSEVDGGFAQFCVAPAANAMVIDSPLSDAELATFPCAYSTAENLISRAALGPDDVIVISGASGGVGSAAIQLARGRGARVIAVASASKAELLTELGAEAVIDRNTTGLAAAILDAAGGPVDVAADVVGAGAFAALIEVLKPGGRYTTSGAIAGPSVELNLRDLIYRDLQFTGATVCPPGTFGRVIDAIEHGAVRPLLAETFPLADLVAAQEAFVAKRHVGNIVVTVD